MPAAMPFAPDFMVIGAMRAGTTSLQIWLRGLDGLCLPRMKETDFFIDSKGWQRGFDWYRHLFRDTGALTGEVCPNYAKRDVFKGVPQRIAAVRSDIRLIYIVRDPVERAISQYIHTWYRDDLPEPDELAGTWSERHLLATSRYAWQMEPWLEAFGREQILFVDFDRIHQEPLALIREVAAHIGATPPERLPHSGRRNSAKDFRRLPGWWHKLRETPAGAHLRAKAPSGVVSAVRSALSIGKAAPRPSAFDAAARARLADALREDAEKFRALSGLELAHWCV